MGTYFESGLGLGCLLGRANRAWLSDLGVRGEALLLSRGRDCLCLITRMLDLKPGDELLVPAFLCGELIEVVESWGLRVRLYDLNRDLSVSPEQVAARVTPASRAVLYVNYFGLAQPPDVVRELRKLGLPLIEDSCQSPFGAREPGGEPDFAFTSLRKYLPVPDGAVLDVLADPWRATAGEFRHPQRVNRALVLWRALACGVRGLQERRDRRALAVVAQELFTLAERALRRGRETARMSSLSRWIAPRLDLAEVRRRRRESYVALAEALAGVASVAVMRAEIPREACPYGCVLLVTGNRLWRDALNHRDIQAAILWESSGTAEHCPETAWLSAHVVVVPVPNLAHAREVAEAIRQYKPPGEVP